MRELIFVMICTLVISYAIAKPSIDMVSGYFTISVDGEATEGKYSKQQTAEEAAVNLSFQCECEVVIHRPDIRVNTKGDVEYPVIVESKTIAWDRPTKRKNGKSLPVGEIEHYIIAYWSDGVDERVDTVSGDSEIYTLKHLEKGEWSVKMMTVDTKGLKSGWTEVLKIKV